MSPERDHPVNARGALDDAQPAFVRLIANLDAESRYARQHAIAAGRTDAFAARHALPDHVMQRLSALGTMMRALGDDRDRLWTPTEVDANRIAAVPGLPDVVLETGEIDADGEPDADAGVDTNADSGLADTDTDTDADAQPPAEQVAWAATDDIAAGVNHRGFAFGIARDLGYALPGARWIRDIGELEQHLAGGAAAASRIGWWVLKAPWSAAGRDQIRGKSSGFDTDADRRRAERLLELHEALLFEPWMERIEDFGTCATVTDDGTSHVTVHRVDIDRYGRFGGIVIEDDTGAIPADDVATLVEASEHVGKRLLAAGYRGPFGIDAWRYRDSGGHAVLQPLGEINARCTFGLIARASIERLQEAGSLTEGAWRLRFGASTDPQHAVEGRIPLLHGTTAEPTAAWLERV